LSVLELSELVKELENRFGVSATAPMVTASATAPAGGDGEESEVEEKTEFSVILKSAGDQKTIYFASTNKPTNNDAPDTMAHHRGIFHREPWLIS